jgi:tetratricopeptide (TPR) repeat protein
MMKKHIEKIKNILKTELKQGRYTETKYILQDLVLDLTNLLLVIDSDYCEGLDSDKIIKSLKLLGKYQIETLSNLANYYFKQGDLESAIKVMENVAKVSSKDSSAFYNLAILNGNIGRNDLKEKYFKKCLEIDPNNSRAKFGCGMLKISQHKFKEGWELYENRFEAFSDIKKIEEKYKNKKRWNGEVSKNTSLVIYSEQGIGDMIFCMRYLPILDNLGIKYYIDTSEYNKQLFKMSKYKINFYANQKCKYFCSFMSLPYCLKNYEFNEDKYKLFFDAYIDPKNDKPKIGITFAGNTSHLSDYKRSMDVRNLRTLLSDDHFDFYLLQRKENMIRKIGCKKTNIWDDSINFTDMSNRISNFEDTYKLLRELDAIVTVDTSIAHMAGSIGMPVYLLLDKDCDYRWNMDNKNTGWYTSWKLFKQNKLYDWELPVRICHQELLGELT